MAICCHYSTTSQQQLLDPLANVNALPSLMVANPIISIWLNSWHAVCILLLHTIYADNSVCAMLADAYFQMAGFDK